MSVDDDTWPDDADGDVFRRLVAHGFNFSTTYPVDFNIDFSTWPPPREALQSLGKIYPDLRVFEPDADADGYVQFQIMGRLSYELVTTTQRRVSALVAQFGGVCESWGVMQP